MDFGPTDNIRLAAHKKQSSGMISPVGAFSAAGKAGYLHNPHSNDEIDLPFEFAGTMLGFWMARVLTKPRVAQASACMSATPSAGRTHESQCMRHPGEPRIPPLTNPLHNSRFLIHNPLDGWEGTPDPGQRATGQRPQTSS
jgi:hypothetical protein